MTASSSSSPALGTAAKAAAVVLLTTALVGSGAPALAAGTHLCDGYKQCASKGMSASGYAAVSNRMYWRMYGGHNCTNYAAYRMVKSGMANTRPWSGGGNAMYWGRYMSKITDNTPRVGAIAWWDDYSPGHVAYVERIVSSDEIIISQDSWGGDFSWARVTKGNRWPDGFIHFNDAELANKAAPKFSGVAKVGGTVEATQGTWSPAPSAVSYAWYVNDRLLPRAKRSSVKLTSWMAGKKLRLKVTASKPGYSTSSLTTVAADEILPGSITASTQPRLSGAAQVDRTLQVSSGSWKPAPVNVAYQWKVDGKKVDGATGQRFPLAVRHVGHQVTVAVTAKRSGYASVTKTLSAGEVALGELSREVPSKVTGSRLRGSTLTLTPGQMDLSATRRLQWLRDGKPIPDATTRTYTLKRRDIGHRVRAQVTYTRPGYRKVVERVGARMTKGYVRLITTRNRVRNGIVFGVTATVAGQRLTEPAQIVVRQGGEVRARGVLENGRGRVRVTGVKPGQRVLRFTIAETSMSVEKVTSRRAYFR